MSQKIKGKRPGEFKKQKQKHQNVQHNRDQLKLLKEERIEQAELFVLDPDGFKRVTIKRFPEVPYDVYDNYEYCEVVYVHHGREKTRLRTAQLMGKDKFPRCYVVTGHSDGGFIDWEDCLGIIVKKELLKPSELNKFNG